MFPLVSGNMLRGTKNTVKLVNGITEGAEAAARYGDDVVDAVNLKPQNLMDELANSGVKYSADDVVAVTKTPDGKIRWLEKGNSEAGLKHIIDGHASDFANRGVNDIPDFLNITLQEVPVKTGIGA